MATYIFVKKMLTNSEEMSGFKYKVSGATIQTIQLQIETIALRGSVDIENGQKGRKTWNYDPLTILGKNISKIEEKKSWKKWKKLPKN